MGGVGGVGRRWGFEGTGCGCFCVRVGDDRTMPPRCAALSAAAAFACAQEMIVRSWALATESFAACFAVRDIDATLMG